MKAKTTTKKQSRSKDNEPRLPVGHVIRQTGRDVKNAVLIVSLSINVLVLVVWLVTQIAPEYNSELARVLFR